MKVIFNHHSPFMLAHGGTQIQIERTKAALASIGVEVEYLEWWNDNQRGDILHQVGWLHPDLISLARNKGWKVVITTLLTPAEPQVRELLTLPDGVALAGHISVGYRAEPWPTRQRSGRGRYFGLD